MKGWQVGENQSWDTQRTQALSMATCLQQCLLGAPFHLISSRRLESDSCTHPSPSPNAPH